MLVRIEDHWVAPPLRNRDRQDLLGQHAAGDGGSGALLAAQRERVLVLSGDTEIGGDVLRRFRHRICSMQAAHLGIDEAPADGRVLDARLARERVRGLRHHEGRAAHALDAAGHRDLAFTEREAAPGGQDRVHSRSAEPVDRGARNRFGKTGEQQRHSRHRTVVLASLVGAAVDHVHECFPVDAVIALHKGAKRKRRKIVSAD